MVRMFAFIPLATPVCSARHRGDHHAGEAGEDQAGADALDRRGGVQLPGLRRGRAPIDDERRAGQRAVPVTITARAPKPCESGRAVANPTRKLATAEGSSRRPDSVIEAPKP